MTQARASNVFIGPYHFARPDLNANAVNEATWFAQSVAPYLQTNYLRPVLDLEVLPAGWSWEQLSAWTETFMVSFTALTGVEPILYISGNYSNNLSSYLTKYDIWIAHWRYNLNLVPNTGHWDEWLAWQWSNQGSSQGIAGRVDLNVTNENFYKMLIKDPALPLGQGFMGSSYEDAEQPAANSTGGFSVQAEEYLHGIDVSNHQNVIQWPLVADDGYTFAIAKATEGWGWDDDYFVDNMQQADAAGVVIGAYHFARPDLNNTAVIEATWFASVVGPYLGEGNIRPVLDLERRGSLSWSQLSTWANDFMVTFENLTGVEPMLYINSYYSNNLDASLNHYDLWIAHWHDINIPPNTGRWSNWVLWQWGGTAVAGVEDPIVDRNVSRSNLHDAVIGETVFWTTN
jgi:GH25 family lysozyme M1 (1,4-beta-N-acetylmuramidase)